MITASTFMLAILENVRKKMMFSILEKNDLKRETLVLKEGLQIKFLNLKKKIVMSFF